MMQTPSVTTNSRNSHENSIPGGIALQLLAAKNYLAPTTSWRRPTTREIVTALYHWAPCLFVSSLVLAQLFGAVWDSTSSIQYLRFGHDPLLGPYNIVGTNDFPYTDRVIACVRHGNVYEPRTLSSLLAAEGVEAILEDSTGEAQHGYRLVQRREPSRKDTLDSNAYTAYQDSCTLISSTIGNILDACTALGYNNLTTDSLRVVESADSNRLLRIPYSLPILIMPYWDNAEQARHAVPTWGGDACVFRLGDAYAGDSDRATLASFRGVNQTIRHERTLQWLNKYGGVWRNGWYEDLEGSRWFSDVTSSSPGAPYYMTSRMFDMNSGIEINCSTQEGCLSVPKISEWGGKLFTVDSTRDENSIAIAGGSSFGIFRYEADQVRVVRSKYDWETLVFNVSVGMVLVRWIMALVTLHAGVLNGGLPRCDGGIGCVSGSRSFDFLLISMLPRLKMTLAAFWTVGCRFEGQQSGLSEAWFTIYPAIAQFMLMFYSLLNLLAKISRRRMSDALFSPSVALLCILHYFRKELADSGWLAGVDGRIPTVVFSDEITKLELYQYFTTDVAWRLNGCVNALFITKLVVLAVNFLPLLTAPPLPILKRGTTHDLHGIQRAFALKASQVGGLGCSPVYLPVTKSGLALFPSTRKSTVVPHHATNSSESVVANNDSTLDHRCVYLNNYELIRLGYLLFGGQYLITFDEWELLTSMIPFRSFYHLWNHRIFVWKLEDVSKSDDGMATGYRTLRTLEPEMWRLDDARLQKIQWWRVSSCAIQC